VITTSISTSVKPGDRLRPFIPSLAIGEQVAVLSWRLLEHMLAAAR